MFRQTHHRIKASRDADLSVRCQNKSMTSIMKNQVSVLTIGMLLLVFSSSALSCSPIDHSKLIEFIIHQSRWYWFVTALMGGLIIYMSRKRHKGILIPLIVLAGIVFHPSWTSTPMYAFSCTGQSVGFSRLLASIFVIFLIYETIRAIIQRLKASTNHAV